MAALVEDHSRLTDRYQTTVPRSVRKQLRLNKGSYIRYCMEADGRVYIEPVRPEPSEADPAVGAFLDLLEADVKAHPEGVRAFDGGLRDRMAALVASVEVDLDAELSPDDE